MPLVFAAAVYKSALMDIFLVIADPTRRRMLEMLRDGEHPAGTFVAEFPMVSQPAISQHLKVLRDSGLVDVRADRQRRLYSLRDSALETVQAWVSAFAPKPVQQKQPDIAPGDAPVAKPSRPKPKAAPKPPPQPELTLDLFG